MSTHEPKYSHASWLDSGIRIPKLREAIARAAEVVRDLEFDAFAARGVSGMLFLTPFALAMNKTVIVSRKDKDGSHSSHQVEGDQAARRYIIVDEFIGSGRTVYEILKAVAWWAPAAECLGVIEVNRLFEELYTDPIGFDRRSQEELTTFRLASLEDHFGPIPRPNRNIISPSVVNTLVNTTVTTEVVYAPPSAEPAMTAAPTALSITAPIYNQELIDAFKAQLQDEVPF